MNQNVSLNYQLKSLIAKAVADCYDNLNLDLATLNLDHPAAEEHGDYSSNVALQISKSLGKSPKEVAQEIVNKVQQNISAIRGQPSLPAGKGSADRGEKVYEDESILTKVEVAGPGFINFWLAKNELANQMHQVLTDKDDYGKGKWGEGSKWLIEHTSPNPNKAMHLGHLRNNLTGMALSNLWIFSGVEVVRDCIDNNRGIAIAKLMWGYLKFGRKDGDDTKVDVLFWFDHQNEWRDPLEEGLRPDRFVDELYVKGSTDFEENKESAEQVKRLVIDWEAGEKHNWALWEKVLAFSYAGQKMTLDRLGNIWDWVWHEHEHYQLGKDLVAEGLEKGVFQKSEGAVVTNLESFGLPNTVVIKSDGTSLYITQDLALTRLKREKFYPDKMFWVIGPEQSLALKQMFAACEQLGIGKVEDYTHIAYGYMSIKNQGKMSSRKGNVLYIDQLIDQAKEKLADFKLDDESLEKIAVGAVKFAILKVGRLQDVAFDLEESVSLNGDSGPYLQYTYARARSVIRKAENQHVILKSEASSGSVEILQMLKQVQHDIGSEELALLRFLYRFPEIVEMAAKQYSPNLVCTYLFDLAKRFNSFYANVPILSGQGSASPAGRQGDSGQGTIEFRLQLTEAVSVVIKNGLKLLGIEVLERM